MMPPTKIIPSLITFRCFCISVRPRKDCFTLLASAFHSSKGVNSDKQY